MAYWGYGGRYGYAAAYDFYHPGVAFTARPAWMVGIHPAYVSVMEWMEEDIYAAWEEWQEDIRGENLTLEQRTSFLRKSVRRNVSTMVTAREREEIVRKILAMEKDLGADQYGHVNAINTQSVGSTMMTTQTTTLTQEERNRAEQMCLQRSGSNVDPQQAQLSYNQIIGGQQDLFARQFLHDNASGSMQANVIQQAPQQQQVMSQQIAAQQPGQQQRSMIQSPLPDQMPPQPMPLQPLSPQPMSSQPMPIHQRSQLTPQSPPQQPRGYGQQQNSSQHTTTTTTTTTSSHHLQGRPMAQGYQQAMQVSQQMQNPQLPQQQLPYHQHLHIASGQQNPHIPEQFNQQGLQNQQLQPQTPSALQQAPAPTIAAPATQDYFSRNRHGSSTFVNNYHPPAAPRPSSASKGPSSREKREPGLNSRTSKGRK